MSDRTIPVQLVDSSRQRTLKLCRVSYRVKRKETDSITSYGVLVGDFFPVLTVKFSCCRVSEKSIDFARERPLYLIPKRYITRISHEKLTTWYGHTPVSTLLLSRATHFKSTSVQKGRLGKPLMTRSDFN